ncbi:hypothetical protein [Paraliobacillus sp. X-1268]|uniref:hypothetical protein n=1 Tax=Paraliobacillus sp. X-1268 TaxID=2213193 RepID=UPI000E3E79F3|nr:hypothetical protein [Paraliobacillus sp. X-1268]
MKLLKSKIFWVSFILIGSFVFFFNYGTPWSLYNSNKEFENHLENEYQSDFIISDISYDLIHNTYHAQAYEINQPDIQFYVGQNIGNKKITDGYKFENFKKTVTEDVTAIAQEYIPEYTKVNVEVISTETQEIEVNIWVDNDVDDELKNKIKTEIDSSEYTTNQLFFNKNNN